MALDAETIAVEHGDVQRIAVKAQVHRFQIDHVMLLLVQRIDDGGQVGGQGQLGTEPRGQAGRARLALLHDLFQLGRLRHVQQGHDETGKAALAVEHGRLRPGDLHVALAVFQLIGQLGRQFQHRFELAPVGGPVQVRVVQLGHLRGRAGQQIHAARAAALDRVCPGSDYGLYPARSFRPDSGPVSRPASGSCAQGQQQGLVVARDLVRARVGQGGRQRLVAQVDTRPRVRR